jgi:hypothetical protein
MVAADKEGMRRKAGSCEQLPRMSLQYIRCRTQTQNNNSRHIRTLRSSEYLLSIFSTQAKLLRNHGIPPISFTASAKLQPNHRVRQVCCRNQVVALTWWKEVMRLFHILVVMYLGVQRMRG